MSALGGCGCSSAAGISWQDRRKLGFAGGMTRSSTAWGNQWLGSEWLVIPSCSSGVPSAAHRCPMLVSASKLPLKLWTRPFGGNKCSPGASNLCAWASVLRARTTPQWCPQVRLLCPVFHGAKFQCCRHRAAWCTGCASVSPRPLQVPEQPAGAQVHSPAHLDGQGNPRRVGGSSAASASKHCAAGLSVVPAQLRNSTSN